MDLATTRGDGTSNGRLERPRGDMGCSLRTLAVAGPLSRALGYARPGWEGD